tara:strand:- start:227 stop:949 length:723 start_codon:yes stop_codon:yes gene_type:complete
MDLKKTFLFLLVSLMHFSCAVMGPANTIPQKAFVKIYAKISILECHKDSKLCKPRTWGSVGSGAIIKTVDQYSYVLTAGHVCNVDITRDGLEEIKKLKIEISVLTSKNQMYESDIIHSNELKNKQVDLCLLRTEKLSHHNIQLSMRKPQVGDRLYSMGAPAGIYHPPTVPILEGIYAGDMPDGLNFLSSLPAVGGSSGSPVFNKDMKLVGVIFASHPSFNHISISTGFEETKKFLKDHLY